MFSGPKDAKRKYNETKKVLLVIRDGFEGMNFAERYLWVIHRRKGDPQIQVIAVTREEYEKYKDRIKEFV